MKCSDEDVVVEDILFDRSGESGIYVRGVGLAGCTPVRWIGQKVVAVVERGQI